MRVEYKGTNGTWRKVADAAKTTIGWDAGDGEPSSSWKRRILIAEHSPIRKMTISAKFYDMPYWVSTHFVRHKFGIEHFVSTQRTDRTGENRTVKPQDAPVDYEFEANFQSIINISKKRLCACASPETRYAWRMFLDEVIKPNEPELYSICVKQCISSGFCPEFKTCGYANTIAFDKELSRYRKGINGN